MSRIFFFDDPASGYYFWKMFSAGIVLLVAMTGLDQDMMQRNLSCATPRDSQKNIILTAFCQIFVILLFLVLGVLLYRYVESTGLPMPAKSDQVFRTRLPSMEVYRSQLVFCSLSDLFQAPIHLQVPHLRL